MCDDDDFDAMRTHRRELLSRRDFSSLSLGVGLATLLPLGCKSKDPAAAPTGSGAATPPAAAPAASAAATTESEVSITTPDGACDSYFVHPTTGAAPAVLVWPDIFGLRPAFRQMGSDSPSRGMPCWS